MVTVDNLPIDFLAGQEHPAVLRTSTGQILPLIHDHREPVRQPFPQCPLQMFGRPVACRVPPSQPCGKVTVLQEASRQLPLRPSSSPVLPRGHSPGQGRTHTVQRMDRTRRTLGNVLIATDIGMRLHGCIPLGPVNHP